MRLPLDISLEEFHISPCTGFLSDDPRLQRLSDPYYEPWEAIGDELPRLLKNISIRAKIDKLPILSTSKLTLETAWRRAYVLLSFLTQGYLWGGETPSKTLPPMLSCPFISVAEHLGLPPITTCASLNLWNSVAASSTKIPSLPEDLVPVQSFTGTLDESWFYVVSNAMEIRGGLMIPLMLDAIHSARTGDTEQVSRALCALAECLRDLEALLGRMYEKCDPEVFYHQIRPWIAGTKGISENGSPNGVFYDQGEGKGSWRELSGASNAQSSLIPFFDIVLGVKHRPTGQSNTSAENNFMKEMRNYMPRQHASFLEQVCPDTIRDYVNGHCAGDPIFRHYNAAIERLTTFRNKHLQIITRYIVLPAKAAASRKRQLQNQSINGNSARGATGTIETAGILGTAGSELVPFLKQTRDETREAVIETSKQL